MSGIPKLFLAVKSHVYLSTANFSSKKLQTVLPKKSYTCITKQVMHSFEVNIRTFNKIQTNALSHSFFFTSNILNNDYINLLYQMIN